MSINVLSLFDGISCGRLALDRANIKVNKYYASEIDKYAIKVSESNYPDIIRLGDITKWKKWKIEKPDIILAGSPCQGFSFAGKGLNFNDPRSKLFFVFIDILKHYKPKYFLLENVIMKYEHNDVISRQLGELFQDRVRIPSFFDAGRLSPVMLNSSLVSAQNRKRLYWCNWDITIPENKRIMLKDVLESGETNRKKSLALIASYSNVSKNPSKSTINRYLNKHMWQLVKEKSLYRKLTVVECERLQTVPDNYCNAVKDSKAYYALGNGWTIDIIAHILKCNKELTRRKH
jgi:DNA (cytosine-5)-methyltransferase 3A